MMNDVNEAKVVELNNSDRYIGVRPKLSAMADWKDSTLRSWLYVLAKQRGYECDEAKQKAAEAFEDFKFHEHNLYNIGKL